MGGTAFGLNPKPLFEDGSGPVLEAVGGEFQPRLATVHPGGGAYLNVALYAIFVLNSHRALIHSLIALPGRFGCPSGPRGLRGTLEAGRLLRGFVRTQQLQRYFSNDV